MAFDTLVYAKRLEESGIDRQQAEAHAEAIHDYLHPNIATKTDLAPLRSDLLGAIANLRQEMAQRELRLVGVIAALLGILFVLIKFVS